MIRQIQLVNIIEPPNGLTFKEQSIVVKKMFYQYGGHADLTRSRVKAIIVDGNGVGKGLVDRLLEDVTDPDTNHELGCFDTINTDQKPDIANAIKIVYDLTATGINDDIIRTFIDYVETEKLKLLRVDDSTKNSSTMVNDDGLINEERARIHTQFLIDEISNLRLKKTSKSITVEQVQRKIDKDRYSALAYALYYVFMFLEKNEQEEIYDEEDDIVYF